MAGAEPSGLGLSGVEPIHECAKRIVADKALAFNAAALTDVHGTNSAAVYIQI